ncbi:FAD-binding oxidoreductase [Pedobacter frigiditerrae]|uniref:D-lactate dehydrogenase (cytochrome) n=1 Tax=Pedobacter frigiditerrae TaxID=2530452 RepID=A0A4R0MPF6_9SPHI|nr:FAD-binding and (Fe-S)-binding domain-containing protein [Pedobacter frigiditerrae]TCC88721.1 FAD-binding oxidoreductase [Pedobacter frigiditerrae]
MKQRDIGELLQEILPQERVKCKLIDLVASASDAGFYYLRPVAVVYPVSESEIIKLFKFSQSQGIPLVFRCAGTSLSGQSITDGILVDLSRHWRKVSVEGNGNFIRVQPGVIGAIANAQLSCFGRKIGPDPASIGSAMMGGIISNNSSGMCCGVKDNTYHTLHSIRFVLPNGKTYDTAEPLDKYRFMVECPEIHDGLSALRERIVSSPQIIGRLRHKYLSKNTVGYGLNAFLDHGEPLEILARLLVGAEGTLAFVSEAMLRTIPDHLHKSTALLYFADITQACAAIPLLTESGAAAIELMDRAALKSIAHIEGIPEQIRLLPDRAAALLIEYQEEDTEALDLRVTAFRQMEAGVALLEPATFSSNRSEQALLWKVRKGMFPSVGAVRARGTTVILEDVAFPVSVLGEAIHDLQALFLQYDYLNAIIFGHAKDGNIHFVITQAFDGEQDVLRYKAFLEQLVELVVKKYDGALKAEHGTGRNMAPFVEAEWGTEIYQLMQEVKQLVDPLNLLNPGVILNADGNAHVMDLKTLTQVEQEVDKCMECGFCEQKCPSRDLTLTPRKRIVVRRELMKLKAEGNGSEYRELLGQYQYQGLDTCAVDGLCATACPVDINTGDLVKRLRRESHSPLANHIALLIAKNFKFVSHMVRFALVSGLLVNKLFGKGTMFRLTMGFRRLMPSFPIWTGQIALARGIPATTEAGPLKVVYFPTCISRLLGERDKGKKGVMQTLVDVAAKAGIAVLIPRKVDHNCCGQIYSSKGFKDAFSQSANDTIELLWSQTQQGLHPVVLDISSCTQTITGCRGVLSETNKSRFDALRFMDSIDFLYDMVLQRLKITQRKERIVLHNVCSLMKMKGLEDKLLALAKHFSKTVTQPLLAGCCGMAGDRGFLYPELTRAANAGQAAELKNLVFDGCYSSSKTCEMALSDAIGMDYLSVLYLVDECSDPLATSGIGSSSSNGS